MSATDRSDQPAEVASKVLRRAQVSKMTRALQNRLALANVKIKHGWENLSLETIEPRVEMELKRKRPGSSNGAMSDTSSCVSERFFPHNTLDSSPLAAPIFSDAVGRSGGSQGHTKRMRQTRSHQYPASSNHARTKVRTSTRSATSWKNAYRLPESSPVYHRRHAHFTTAHIPTLSFVSETSTIPDNPLSPQLSEEDDSDLPLHSFQVASSHIMSSPPPRSPHTPPPTMSRSMSRSARLRNHDPFTTTAMGPEHGEADANLLMFLAHSPSPARGGTVKRGAAVPSTPPSKATPLPSSMMSTPGGGGAPFTGFGLTTPGTNVNFADFLNMSPSPAQIAGPWTRTPVASKTPIATREARRRLNFDTLLPPTGSPNIGGSSRIPKAETGLGMDLGGELVS